MRSSAAIASYIRAVYRRFDDEALAQETGLPLREIRRIRQRHRLFRSGSDRAWIRAHSGERPPTFDGMDVADNAKPTSGFARNDIIVASLAAASAFLVFTKTLCPTVYGEDAGELVSAAYSLGIAHPPGYPLWCLLGKVFITILPIGNVAWRVNLMSAVFGTLTVYLLYFIVRRLTDKRWACFSAAMAFAFSGEFWEQSVISEVYTLNAFLIATCVLLLFRWYENRRNRELLTFSIVYGLGLCNHNTMHLLGPLFIGFVLAVDRAPWRRWKLYLGCTAVAVSALCLYVYLPIRSQTNPPVDWGDPENFENFWDVVTRKQYTFSFAENPRNLSRIAAQLAALGRLYVSEFAPWLAWLPILGIWAGLRRDRLRSGLLLALLLWVSVGFMLIVNFDIDPLSLWVNNVFYIPAYLAAAAFMGVGLAWLSDQYVHKVSLRPAAWTLAIVTALSPLFWNFAENDKSDYYFAEDFGRNILNTLEKDAIYFPTADHATFPVLYLQSVVGLRPDVTIANKYGYIEKHLYADMPGDMKDAFHKIPSEQESEVIEEWIIQNEPERPVYFTKKRPFARVPGLSLANAGLLFRLVRKDEAQPNVDYWMAYRWHSVESQDVNGDLTAGMVLSDYHFARGRHLFDNSDREEGMEQFALALRVGNEDKEALNNIGSACAERGETDAAIGYYRRSLELDPDYATGKRNLAKVLMVAGRVKDALRLCEEVLKRNPLDPEINWVAYDCLKAQGRVDESVAQLKRMLTFPYHDFRVPRELGMYYLNVENNPAFAREYFALSLAINSEQADVRMLMVQTTGQQDTFGGMPSTFMPDLPGMNIPQLPQLPRMQ